MTDNRAGGKSDFRGESQPVCPLEGLVPRKSGIRSHNPRGISNLERRLAKSPALL